MPAYPGYYVSTITFGVDVDPAQVEIIFTDENGKNPVVTLLTKDNYAGADLAIAVAALVAKASVTLATDGKNAGEQRTWLTDLMLDISGLPHAAQN